MPSLQGQLLVASPGLLDPNFRRTVVLITEHNEEGAAGLILNRPSDAYQELSALVAKNPKHAVGYSRMVHRGARPCWHGGSAGAGRSTAHSFATHRPGIAGCELMPSRRCVAAAATFPRPRMSDTCTASGTGTSGRPRGRSPTAEPGSTATIAATVAAAAVGSAKGATPSVETATSASVGATASAATAVTTAMLSKGGRGEANEAEGYDS